MIGEQAGGSENIRVFKNTPIKIILKHYFQLEEFKCKHRHKHGNTNQVLLTYLRVSKLFWSQANTNN